MKKLIGVVLVLASVVSAATYSWNTVAIGGGGFVSGIVTSPTEKNLIYARTDVGGAYRWNEAGQSWTPLLDWLPIEDLGLLGVEALATDPIKPQNLYMLLGISYFSNGKTVVARSRDYGATFQYTEVTSKFTANGNGSNRHTGERLAIDPNSSNILFCGSRTNGLFKSLDSGVTWNAVSSFPVTTTTNGNGINFVIFDKSSGSSGSATQTIYVGVQCTGASNFYVSKDGGSTWNPVASAPTTYMPERAVLTAAGKFYITYGDANNAAGSVNLYDSKLSSNAWKEITPLSGHAYGGVTVDAQNPSRVMVSTFSTWWSQPWGNGDRMFLSTDAGTSWTDLFGASKITMDANGFPWIANHAVHWAGSLEIDPFNSDRAFVTSGNGLFSTSNLSASVSSWKFQVKGIEEVVPSDFISLPGGSFYSVIGDYDGFIHSNVAVAPQSTHTPAIGSTQGLAFAWKKPTRLARSATNAMYWSDNSGSNWTQITPPNGNATSGIAYSADGASLLWSDNTSLLYRSSNNGASWTQSTSLGFNSLPIPDAVNPARFYVYNPSSGNFFASADSGKTFTQKTSPGTWGSGRVRAVPGYEADVWLAMYNGGLKHSTDGGVTYTTLANVTTCAAVGVGKAASGKTYPAILIWGKVGGVEGLHISDDAGATWTRINDAEHQYGGPGNAQIVDGDMNLYGRVYMSTAGRGIVYGTASVGAANSAPTNITLSQASINENLASATTVGTLSATDPDAGNTFTYSLVTGTGATDNASFTMSGTALKTAAVFDYETKASYAIRVRVTDQGGLTFEKIFTLTVNNVNEAPSITSAATASIHENTTAVLTVTSTDPDAGATKAYSINGGLDASKFTINGTSGALSFVTAPNFEIPTDNGANNVYDVIVQVSDGALTATKGMAVTVTDVVEAVSSSSATSSSSIASSSSVAVSSSSRAVLSSSSVSATALLSWKLNQPGVRYEIRDLLGRPVLQLDHYPTNLPQGRWVIVAVGTNGQKLGSWLH